MIERIKDYKGYLLKMPGEKKNEALLFLHGFPANVNIKNLDVALSVRDELNTDVLLNHYKGLGENPGEFLYTQSVLETADLVKWLIQNKGYNKIHLVGHSWGGLVSVNCAIIHPEYVGSLILLSPFCFTSKDDPNYEWFIEEVKSDCPTVFGNLKRKDIETDFNIILEKYLPTVVAPKISTQIPVAIIQAKNDDATPAELTKQFASQLKKEPLYVELDQDHSFTKNRIELSNTISQIFRKIAGKS